MVDFRLAVEADIQKLAKVRYECWNYTYRGIYDDVMIDEFDFKWHEDKFLRTINDHKMKVYVIESEKKIIGYFSIGKVVEKEEKCFKVRLYSLYVLPEYHRIGIGSRVLESVKAYCSELKKDSFFLTCNAHNKKGRTFYEKMGGILTAEDVGYNNRAEDTCYFEFNI